MPQMVDELPFSRTNRLRAVTEAIDEGRAKRAKEAEAQG